MVIAIAENVTFVTQIKTKKILLLFFLEFYKALVIISCISCVFRYLEHYFAFYDAISRYFVYFAN